MGADPGGAAITFFELDRLFSRAARVQRRKAAKRRRKERQEGANKASPSRSRSASKKPPKIRKISGLGGFTGVVEKVEKAIIISGVPEAADERTLFKHFTKCGTVVDVRIMTTRHGFPTGYVVIEFAEDDALNRACSLPHPHNEILGAAVQVKRADSQIKKDGGAQKKTMTRQQFTQQVLSGIKTGGLTTSDSSGPNMRKLHIKNLRPVVTEEDMRGIFKPFGEFEAFTMGMQECWITFKNYNDAQDAMGSMQGFQLVGQELQIVAQPVASVSTAVPAAGAAGAGLTSKDAEAMDLKGDSDFGATGPSANPLLSRIELMKKLMSSHQQQGVPTVVGAAIPGATGGAVSPAPAVPPTPKPGGPSARTLLLQNMFTPQSVNLQKEPRFYDEIREDTHEECTKFGKVLHVTVDPRGSTGLIYVLYEQPSQRLAAENSLNGRWFEGKKIIAMGIDDSIWQALAAQAQPSGSTA